MTNETTPIWITKYALTKGVIATEDKPRGCQTSSVYMALPGRAYPQNFYFGKDVFWDRDQALMRADRMRLEKIASLEKQIAKLKRLKFD